MTELKDTKTLRAFYRTKPTWELQNLKSQCIEPNTLVIIKEVLFERGKTENGKRD